MYKIEEFISLVENHNFIEAHEILEYDWKDEKKKGNKQIAKFLQGLINGTTSIALYLKGREDASVKVWATFIKYKDILNEVDLSNKSRYSYAIELLETKYLQKDKL
jgi:predicted metal-dependent hydrolase